MEQTVERLYSYGTMYHNKMWPFLLLKGKLSWINYDDPHRYHNYIINLNVALSFLSNEELVDKTNIIDKMLARLQQYIDFYSDRVQYHIIFASYQEMELYDRLEMGKNGKNKRKTYRRKIENKCSKDCCRKKN